MSNAFVFHLWCIIFWLWNYVCILCVVWFVLNFSFLSPKNEAYEYTQIFRQAWKVASFANRNWQTDRYMFSLLLSGWVNSFLWYWTVYTYMYVWKFCTYIKWVTFMHGICVIHCYFLILSLVFLFVFYIHCYHGIREIVLVANLKVIRIIIRSSKKIKSCSSFSHVE